MSLEGKNVVLGVTSSIAAYKAADLASKLVQTGARVDVVMSESASRFVTPFTFRAITGHPALFDMFQPQTDQPEEHVSLARRADLIVIAPASATVLAKIAHGIADDMVSLTVLATRAPVIVAPAMDGQMWENAATQANIEALRSRGIVVVGPAHGRLASGNYGPGRMVEPDEVLGAVKLKLAERGDLAGRHIIVSAGGTREPIDAVRVISNRSSGKMGFALAEAARDRGAKVTLVTTTRALPIPYGIAAVDVETVAQLRDGVLEASAAADCLIMAAAVSDYRPADPADHKLKKTEAAELTLRLVQVEDFFQEVPARVVKVAFAAETENLVENARRKTESHGALDLICANDVSATDAGFAVDTNRVVILDAEGGVEDLGLLSKYDTAWRILDRVWPLIEARRNWPS